MKKIIILFGVLIFHGVFKAQERLDIRIKNIKSVEGSYVFKFKNLKTKKVDYFFSYKKDNCEEGLRVKTGEKYNIQLLEINIPHQKDGNEYLLKVDDFIIPTDHKLYYSEDVKGLFICKE